jgi:hypothetical protein
MDKVIFIDDISVIIKDKNFIRDNIPRFLAKCIEEKYKLWLRIDKIDNSGILDYDFIPSWLKQSIIFINDEILENLGNYKFSKDSFIISNSLKPLINAKKLKLNVYSGKDIFDCKNCPQINFSDLILCFGFEEDEYISFCYESNLLNLENYIKNKKIYNGVAFKIKSNNLEIEYKDVINKFNDLINKKSYSVKHKNLIIGATKNGKGLEGLNLNIINNKKIPLILI